MQGFVRSLAATALIASAVLSSSLALPGLNADTAATLPALNSDSIPLTAQAQAAAAPVLSSVHSALDRVRITIVNSQLSTLYSQRDDEVDVWEEIPPGGMCSYEADGGTGGTLGHNYDLGVKIQNLPTWEYSSGAGNDAYFIVQWSHDLVISNDPYTSIYFTNQDDPEFPESGSTGDVYFPTNACHEFGVPEGFHAATYCRTGDSSPDAIIRELEFTVYGPYS